MLNGGRIYRGNILEQRRRSGNMHGNMFAEFFKLGFVGRGFKRNQNADFAQIVAAAIVQIRRNNTVVYLQHGGTTQGHVLADFGNQVSQALFKSFVAFRAVKRLHVAKLAGSHQGNLGRIGNIFLKQLVFGNEIGLGVNLGNGAFVTLNINRNQTFGSNTAGFFGRGSQTLFAQPVNGGVHIAVALNQSLFAIQHAGAG